MAQCNRNSFHPATYPPYTTGFKPLAARYTGHPHLDTAALTPLGTAGRLAQHEPS